MTKTIEERAKDIDRRSKEDFNFMVLCSSKRNMAMYQMLRDPDLDQDRKDLERDQQILRDQQVLSGDKIETEG